MCRKICDVTTEGLTPPTHCGPFFMAIKITTLCSRFPLHKMIIAQLGKKLLAFYRNRRSFSACTRIPIVTQMNTVHNFLYMSFSLIFPFWPRFSKWSLYFRFCHQNSVGISIFFLHKIASQI